MLKSTSKINKHTICKVEIKISNLCPWYMLISDMITTIQLMVSSEMIPDTSMPGSHWLRIALTNLKPIATCTHKA